MSVVINGNGQVSGFIVGAEDLDPNAIPPSDKLSKNFVVETGKSTTANRAISINGNGKVGEYPAAHTLATPYDDTSLTTTGDWVYSNNAKVAVTVTSAAATPSNGSYRVYFQGYALPSDSASASGTQQYVDLSYTGSTIEYNSSRTATVPFGYDNKFFTYFFVSTRHGGNSTHYNRCYVVVYSVDEATGNITFINSAQTGSAYSNNNVGATTNLFMVDHNNETIAFVVYGPYSSGNIWYHNTYDNGSWTQVTTTNSTSNFGGTGVFYSGNTTNITYANGANQYTANKDGSNFWYSSTQSSPTLVLSNYSSSANWYFPSVDRAIAYYLDGNGAYRLAVFDVSSSDGSFTETDNIVIDRDELLGGNNISHWFSKDKNNIGFASTSTVVTFTIDVSGNIENFSPTVITNSIVDISYSGSDTLTLHRFPISNQERTGITINAWSSNPFSLIGIANTSESAGDNVSVTVAGIQGGFTGLTAGKVYSVNKNTLDGTLVLSTSSNAGEAVGRAVSSTEILVGDTA